MTHSRNGLCIGGPMDGRLAACFSNEMHVRNLENVALRDHEPAALATAPEFIYAHVVVNTEKADWGFWVDRNIPEPERSNFAMGALISYYETRNAAKAEA